LPWLLLLILYSKRSRCKVLGIARNLEIVSIVGKKGMCQPCVICSLLTLRCCCSLPALCCCYSLFTSHCYCSTLGIHLTLLCVIVIHSFP
jgi:hypothetical protein